MLDKVGLLAHPALQGVLRKAADLRSDLVEHLDSQISQIAKHFKLHTRAEVLELKRLVRELENQVGNLSQQLGQERTRAEQQERTLNELNKTHKKSLQTAENATVERHQLDELRSGLEAELAAVKDALLKAEGTLKDKNEDLARLEGELRAAKDALARQDADLKQAAQAAVEAKPEAKPVSAPATAANSKKSGKGKKGSATKA